MSGARMGFVGVDSAGTSTIGTSSACTTMK